MEYKTLSGPVTASLEEKKSRFIAAAAPAATEAQALAFLEEIKKSHRTASHNVYAYNLREGMRTRYSDDGEPAKTAGLPVLEVIRHSGLSDVIIVVTRYFGGTLLGTGGLVRAYTGAARAALQAGSIVSMQECVRLCAGMDYGFYEGARRLLLEAGAALGEARFADKVSLSAVLLSSAGPGAVQALSELGRGSIQCTLSQPFFAPLPAEEALGG